MSESSKVELTAQERSVIDNERAWKVLIVNAWGGNRGDEAMINTLARLLKDVHPRVEVTVTPFRNEDLDVDNSIIQRRSLMADYWYIEIPSFLVGMLKYRVSRRGLKVIANMAHKFGYSNSKSLIRDTALVISSPQGPTLGDMYGAKEKIVEPLKLAARENVPYMILAISAGPFSKNTSSRNYVGRVLKDADRIVVREEVSLGYLKSEYPDLNNVEAAIDIVYAKKWSLSGKPKQDVQEYESYMQAVGLGAVGACISLTPARDPSNPFDVEEYIEKFVQFVDHVLGKTQGSLLLFPHLEFDLPVLEKIKLKSHYPERVKILPPKFDSDFQRDAISRMSFFVSSRYHPTIFAVQAKVPFVCIKNQFKVEGMLDRIGLSDAPSCWQDQPVEEFKKAFDQGWDNREEWAKRVGDGAETAERIASVYFMLLESQYLKWVKC